jgi:hypothetical protein
MVRALSGSSLNHERNGPETCLHSKHPPGDSDKSYGSSVSSAVTRGMVSLQGPAADMLRKAASPEAPFSG